MPPRASFLEPEPLAPWNDRAVFGAPTVTLDRDRRVLSASADALAIIRQDARFRYDGKRLSLARCDVDARLRAILEGHDASSALPLLGDDERPTLLLWTRWMEGAALLTIRAAVPPPPPPRRLLHELYELTAAEARLAVKLAGGSRLSDAAAELGVSIHTARSQLRQVFTKTSTSRQTELLRVLLALSPPGSRWPATELEPA